MRRTLWLAVAALVIFPVIALAADVGNRDVVKFGEFRNEVGYVIVPVEIVNDEILAAVDLPLKWSEGATLERVVFTNRAKSFQNFTNIKNADRSVIIVMIAFASDPTPRMTDGLDMQGGAVAELYFKVKPGVSTLTVDATKMTKPSHQVMLIYNSQGDQGISVEQIAPKFESREFVLNAPGRPAVPDKPFVSQNAPNPFNPITRIAYGLPVSGHVRLEVFNILGQNVKTLVDGFEEAGFKSVVWDGKDDQGNSVASGIYLYRINAGTFSDVKKMTLLK